MILKNNRAFLPCYFEIYASFHSHMSIQNGVTVRNRQIWVKIGDLFCPVWPWNLTDDLEKQQGTSSMLLQALCIISYPLMNSNWSYSPEMPNLGQNRRFFVPCDLEIWWMTSKNNRAHLLSNIKLCASFHHHMWIQTGVTVRKRLCWALTSVTLTFDFWPWPFAWTSLLSLVITPENFMMIRWWEHSQKGVTDRRTDGQTDGQADWTIHRAAWSQLKTVVLSI